MPNQTMKLAYLGGITAHRFLQVYWQKKPLLIRQAFPAFKGIISPKELFRLGCRDDVESRLISQRKSGWQLAHGPFTRKDFVSSSNNNWTLLIQDLNHVLPQASELLQLFRFIPHARVDDVMVSYATIGGGVGPHFDSYDVFLLQGPGKRRWRISSQEDLQLDPNAPLRILSNFKPEQEWELESGDMLYLPPGVAHEGVALTECMTYSIGFRAPATYELANAFLNYMQDGLSLDGRYEDPDLSPSRHPGEISNSMVKKAAAILQKIKWEDANIADFLAGYLSEPKPHVFFAAPEHLLTKVQFALAVRKRGLKLALKSRMLYRKNVFYINGERFQAPRTSIAFLRELSDNRRVNAQSDLDDKTLLTIWQWYCAGFLELLETEKSISKKPSSRRTM